MCFAVVLSRALPSKGCVSFKLFGRFLSCMCCMLKTTTESRSKVPKSRVSAKSEPSGFMIPGAC